MARHTAPKAVTPAAVIHAGVSFTQPHYHSLGVRGSQPAPVVIGKALPAGAQRVNSRLASLKPINDQLPGNAEQFTPFSGGFALSIDVQINRITAVHHLLKDRGPSAVSGFIVPVVVDPVDRHPARRLAHIGQETREVRPSAANLNPAPSVSAPSFGVARRIKTAAAHMHPNFMRARSAHSVGHIFGVSGFEVRPRNFGSKASTRLRSARQHVQNIHSLFRAAIANAPCARWHTSLARDALLNEQSAEFHSDNRSFGWHGKSLLNFGDFTASRYAQSMGNV